MAFNENEVRVAGHVGKDPIINTTTKGGHKVADISIAVANNWKDKDGQWQERPPTWIPVVAWRGLAAFIEKYVRKGMNVSVRGEWSNEKWQDKDGNNRLTVKVKARVVQVAGKLQKEEPIGGQIDPMSHDAYNNVSPADDDDLPY